MTDRAAFDRAVETVNPDGKGSVVLLCEHASAHVPARYGGLGLTAADGLSHAAWDPGALAVARTISRALDAPMVASRVSRLVYDCNRPPEAASAMPETSELIEIPGNRGLTPQQREERVRTVYRPFCAAVSALLAQRRAAGTPTAVVSIHSFTPVYFGKARAVDMGILHDEDTRLADAMLRNAPLLPHRRIARNDPYGPLDGVTHSLRIHGVANSLPNVMIELRNDLLRTDRDQKNVAGELLTLMEPALQELGIAGEGVLHA